MNCLRCGRETTDQQVFCDQCLKRMESDPVKPGTPVYIPVRKAAPEPKKSRRHPKHARTPEEQLSALHRAVRRLWITVCVLVLLLGLSIASIQYLWTHKPPKFNIGQNFQTAEETTTVPSTGE